MTNRKEKDDHDIDDHHRRFLRNEESRQQQQQQRPRSGSTGMTPNRFFFTPFETSTISHQNVGMMMTDGGAITSHPSYPSSPASRRTTISAIYQATHPTEQEDGSSIAGGGGTDGVWDVRNSSMRRAARELLNGTRMRSRQLIVDLHYQRSSSFGGGGGGGDGDSGDLQGVSSTGSSSSSRNNSGIIQSMDGTTRAADDNDQEYYDNNDDDENANVPVEDGFKNQPEDEESGWRNLSSNNGASQRGSFNHGSRNTSESTPLIPPKVGQHGKRRSSSVTSHPSTASKWLSSLIQQSSAVAVVALLNIMVSIPFGASYFPIGWRATDATTTTTTSTTDDNMDDGDAMDDVKGIFPLPGKQALGIRMFLFATIMGQLAFTFASKFENPIGLQMVENVPFLHALCHTVIRNQGYGKEALSTIFFLFAFSSVVVGITFYLLGKWKLGRIVYFFPNHVLVGCIGGIGVFIVVTSIEVTSDVTFTFDMDGLHGLIENFHLLSVMLGFELVLRFLQYLTQDKHGNAKYPLLSPVYYCLITPLFYLGLLILGVSIQQASDQGYFFPPIVTDDMASDGSSSSSSIWQDPYMWDIFHVIDFSTISWTSVYQSTGTMIALTAFSLIHVPINIPAFAISTDVDTDMNAELIAHGYANALSGICGGLQTYMTYSNSVLYAKSGGKGKISSLAIVAATAILFVIGPSIASYLPRCMAGTLLLHIGIDLILEGVYDSFGSYDHLEYAGIWAITLVMTIWGMTAALIAGVIAALTTYAVQSINYQNPIRQILTASTLRSSAWTRCVKSRAILDDDTTGRARILIFQLQGHLFFGNVAQLTDTIKNVLNEKKEYGESPLVVIIDFTLVVGMDSSAAHAVAKLKKIIHRLFHVEVSIFVTGSGRGGFPCEYALSEALSPEAAKSVAAAGLDYSQLAQAQGKANTGTSPVQRGSISVSRGSNSVQAAKKLTLKADGRVYESLDDALRFAEDILIGREDPTLEVPAAYDDLEDLATVNTTLDEEKFYAKKFFRELLPEIDDLEKTIDVLLGAMKREVYSQNDILWESGAESNSMKLVIRGELLSFIEDTGASDVVKRGNFVGELGLVHGTKRLTTLICSSDQAVLYTLSRADFERLKKKRPQVTAAIDGVVIRYLAHRVQHVNNRYFHTTLPV